MRPRLHLATTPDQADPPADPSAELRRLHSSAGLTPRETEILRLIALGHTSAEMAAKLRLSPRTIETHRARIHRKLGTRTRAELVQHALTNHLIST